MADAPHIPNEAETRARGGAFAWTPANAAAAAAIIRTIDVVFGECDR